MPPRGPFLRRSWQWAIAVGIVVGTAVGGFGLVYPGVHTYCALGDPVASTSLATPLALVNTPFDGASSINLSGYGPEYSFGSGSLGVSSDPWIPFQGEDSGLTENDSDPSGLYMFVTWTVYSVENTTGITPGNACTQPYVAEANPIPRPANSNYPVPGFQLALPNVSTDLGEPNAIPGLPSVLFYNGLNPQLLNVTARSGITIYYPYAEELGDCPGGPYHSWTFYASGTLRVPITVPFTFRGRALETHGFLTWSGENGAPAAAYTMPAIGGDWVFTSVGAPFPRPPSIESAPDGLLSFSYLPCPS